MKEIILAKGQVAVVSDEDYGALSQIKWHLSPNGYAITTTHYYDNGVRKTQHPSMHRTVMGAQSGEEIDHINRNKLDNRRINLRKCTRRQNILNTKIRVDNTSGYKGVRRRGNRPRWTAEIGYFGKTIFLGHFNDIEDAIAARIAAEKRYHACA